MDKRQIWEGAKVMVPLLGQLGLELEKFEDHEAAVRLPLDSRTKNHVNTIYAGALFTVGEAAGGLPLFLHHYEDNLILVTEAKITYLKKADGDVIARARYSAEDKARVLAAIEAEGKTVLKLPISIEKADGAPVATLEIDYYLRAKGK